MIVAAVDRLSLRLVPDELWELAELLIPVFESRPQGGDTAPVDARAVFTASVYVLTSGCAWRDLPPSFEVPFQTAHRRFSQWTKAGLWRRLHHALLGELGSQGIIEWSRAIMDGACVRAEEGLPDRPRASPKRGSSHQSRSGSRKRKRKPIWAISVIGSNVATLQMFTGSQSLARM